MQPKVCPSFYLDSENREASHIVNDSIWRTSKILGASIENMAMAVNITADNLLNMPLKNTFPLLLVIEKRFVVQRIASQLAVDPTMLYRCFSSKRVRIFSAYVNISDLKNGKNILIDLSNNTCFLKWGTIGALEKLSNTSIETLSSLNLISLAQKLFEMERLEVAVNLKVWSEQLILLENHDISQINGLFMKYNKPSLKSLTIPEAAMNILAISGKTLRF